MLTLYGIPNCDTVKKARKYLDQKGIAYYFHDFKQEGLSPERLQSWMAQNDWSIVLNARSTTWRELPQEVKDSVKDAASAAAVLLDNLSMIKRPVLEEDGRVLQVGFDQKLWEAELL